MKKLTLYGVLGIIVVIAIAIFSAGQMGETSHAHVRGKVVLDDQLKDAAKGMTTLFIIVHDKVRPMPYGALRTTLSGDLSGDLYEFALTNESVQRMMPDLPWPDPMNLKVRLDRDGSGGPDQPGDLVGELQGVQAGSTDVVLTINRVVP